MMSVVRDRTIEDMETLISDLKQDRYEYNQGMFKTKKVKISSYKIPLLLHIMIELLLSNTERTRNRVKCH
jgi:hypothetical protein